MSKPNIEYLEMRVKRVKELLDENGLEYSVLGKINPICFIIEIYNKKSGIELMSDTDSIDLYVGMYNLATTFQLTNIHKITGFFPAHILDRLNKYHDEEFFISEDNYLCALLTKSLLTEKDIIDKILYYKKQFEKDGLAANKYFTI